MGIPHKTARGAAALDRLKSFEGIPHCLKVLRLRPERRYCKLGDLSHSYGWKHKELLQRLEGQRKVKSLAFHKKKVASTKSRQAEIKKAKVSAEDVKVLQQAGFA